MRIFMKISFDLDDTLFVSPEEFQVEKELKFPWNKFYKERLRYGTVALMKYIKEQNIQLWIYTTSFRSERYIRKLFRCYGIKIDEVVNGARHQREVQGNKTETMPSKYPSKYRIDLHIDDDISVAQNGKTFGFKVLIIKEEDSEWDKKIIAQIEKLKSNGG